MRHIVSMFVLSAAAVFALVAPPRAAACSCLGTPIYRSDPVDGARDVPLNQAIMLEGVFVADSIRLEDESGNPVEFERNSGPWPGGCAGTSLDLIPNAPLASNTRYTIRVEPLYPQGLGPSERSSMSFTTGTTMLPDRTLEPPHGSAAAVFDGPEAMCGDSITAYTCLDLDEPEGIELILRRGDEVLTRTTTLVQDEAAYGTRQAPDCVELRRRAPTGKRSAPLVICKDALGARPWVPTDSQKGVIQCRDGVIGAPLAAADAGMSFAPSPPTNAGASAPQAGASAPQAGSGAEAGARADAQDPQPSAAGDAAHRSYGCATTGRDGGSGAWMFAVFAVTLIARRRSRG